MFSWLADNAVTVSVVLGFIGLALGTGWWMTRERRYGIAALVVFCLIALVWLLRSLTVTDSQRLHRTLQEMTDAVAARRADVIMANVSESFELSHHDKAFFGEIVEHVLASGHVQSLWIADFSVRELSRSQRRATVLFNVGGTGP